jgi:hypothetical protein
VLGIYNAYQQKRANDRQLEVAKQQAEIARRSALEEEQARNKANQKEVDVEGLLSDNTTAVDLGETNLTGPQGARKRNVLNKNAALLGG